MSGSTPRHGIPYPSENSDPWFSDFESMVSEIDSQIFALHESRNLFASGGGTVAWNATTGVLSWSEGIVFTSPTTGVKMTLAAGDTTGVPVSDGGFVYVSLTRGPTSTASLSHSVASKVSVFSTDHAIAYRSGTSLYLWTGLVLADGESSSGINQSGSTVASEVLVTSGQVKLNDDQQLVFGTDDDVAIELDTDSFASAGFEGLYIHKGSGTDPILFAINGYGGWFGDNGAGGASPIGTPNSVQALQWVYGYPSDAAGSISLVYAQVDNASGQAQGASGSISCVRTKVAGNASDSAGSEYVGFDASYMSNEGGLGVGYGLRVSASYDVGLDILSTDNRVDGFIRFGATSDPSTVADKGFLYCKDDSGDKEMFFMDGGGNVIQMTLDGKPMAHMDSHLMIAGKVDVDNPAGTVSIGQIAFDGSRIKSQQGVTLKLVVVGMVTAAETGTVQLYNLTDAEDTGSAVTVTATSTTKHEVTLTLGNGANELKLSDKIYEVRASVTGSSGSDVVTVGQAYLRAEV